MTPSIEKDAIVEALRRIVDPAFDKDIVSLGLVKDVRVRGTEVLVELEWNVPAFPSLDRLKDTIRAEIDGLGATRVDIQERTLIRGHRSADKQQLKDVKNIVAVASGKGGVGKSTLSANLALSLARAGASVGLLDADVYGPSMGLMFGVTEKPRASSDNTILPIDTNGMKLMSMAFLANDDTPVIWRGPMVHGLVQQFLNNVDWGSLDYLIIDLPPGTGDAQLTLTQSAPLSGAVIITTPQEVSLIDARKGLRMFREVKVPVLGIVENMSGFACPHCGEVSDIFSSGGAKQAATDLGVPFLGAVPIDPDVVRGGDEGTPIVARNPESPAATAYAVVAEQIAASLAKLSSEPAPEGDFFVDW